MERNLLSKNLISMRKITIYKGIISFRTVILALMLLTLHSVQAQEYHEEPPLTFRPLLQELGTELLQGKKGSIVAVDPDVIPLGTRLFIPGYGEAVAADTGGAIIGNRIDLVMDSYGEAMDFGRRDVTVYVLD